MLAANWFTAGATGLLAIFAIITTVYAARAFHKQSEALKNQRDVNFKQTEVFQLQYRELQESLAQRKREADERRRDQAERVDVTWTDNEPDPDDDDWPDKSMVTVINGSRRPIRRVTCKLNIIEANPARESRINMFDCDELIADPETGSFTFPKGPRRTYPWVGTLRGGGRAGFRFLSIRRTGPLNYALVEFTDDAGNRWSLTSTLHLKLLESPPDSATDAEKDELTSGQETL